MAVGQHLEITVLHVYDGERRIAAHDLLAIDAISDVWKPPGVSCGSATWDPTDSCGR